MPVWLQLVSAISSALVSGFMGIAFVPFLEKCRFCMPDPEQEQQNSETISGNQLKPSMYGVLLVFGTLAGLVLSMTLYFQFSGTDRTSIAFQEEIRSLRLIMTGAVLSGILGFLKDYRMIVKRNLFMKSYQKMNVLLMFLLNLVLLYFLPEQKILNFGLFEWNAGFLSIPFRAVLLTAFWYSMQNPEQHTDGVTITAGAVQLLFLAVWFLSGKHFLFALLALTSAGACLGCFYWNLPPAKCRLGAVGTSFLGLLVPVLCLSSGEIQIFFLYFAVWILNLLPAVTKKQTLLVLLKQDGRTPLQRILVLTGFSLFCGVLLNIT